LSSATAGAPRNQKVPDVEERGLTLGSDPLAIYKLTGAKTVNAAKAMGNFTGWNYTAVNAIASEVVNIDFRLYKITGTDHEELDEHPVLDLLDGANERMTGIEFKYTMMELRCGIP
jgi:phage portal protein BeeE